jgi:hypothetical protein
MDREKDRKKGGILCFAKHLNKKRASAPHACSEFLIKNIAELLVKCSRVLPYYKARKITTLKFECVMCRNRRKIKSIEETKLC